MPRTGKILPDPGGSQPCLGIDTGFGVDYQLDAHSVNVQIFGTEEYILPMCGIFFTRKGQSRNAAIDKLANYFHQGNS